MQVILADSMGFCFGVREALALALRTEEPASVTIHGELVHNPLVQARLEQRGFHLAAEHDRERLPDSPRVMITAHGISERERGRLTSAGLRLIDTTCPLVRQVHTAARSLAAEGRHVIVIGRVGHVEVRGIVEDLDSVDVIESPVAARRLRHQRIGVVCQSTTSPQLARQVLAAIREQNPDADIEFVDTICLPTRARQQALQRLLPLVEAVVVVGGRNSNNTRELAALCAAAGKPAWHVESAADLQADWFAGVQVIGLTAGTSTLDETIEEVRAALARMK